MSATLGLEGAAPELAIAIGVAMAGLLTYRQKLHHFARSQLSEAEMRDGLVLLIAALVVLPLAMWAGIWLY
ncbi:hypothetical protein [Pseudomonas chlororaphis]|uniref:hypothetical protein n=1 Tax=Pseudomonas chlororaphis TaxID=587753 RepID=UPI00209F8902|nr:hypothetical protein [Pseudomonas chlororaphis]MCP1478824.1 uncharacterized membrane protein (DUF4010 family) [Pseudomonas chlororaphis]MCP1594824.1 uncharacterized membrane protein (DUF4010 family) [Pseudomonas chlororaphis]WDG57311.1 hypothetical protein PUP76_26420 [Pseudomonas chlororaphis]WDH91530.1 hypothetical protein PUP74_15760 [Pseudomonas chlororaphis]